MIGKGAQYLTAAGFGRYRITAASLGNLDLLDSLGWLSKATMQAIIGAFGERDGMAVIKATNAYLNQLAASDRDKAQQIADWLNTYAVEDPKIAYSLVEGIGTRYCIGNNSAYIDTGLTIDYSFSYKMKFVFVSGQPFGNAGWRHTLRNTGNLEWYERVNRKGVASITAGNTYTVECGDGFYILNGTSINLIGDNGNVEVSSHVTIFYNRAGKGDHKFEYFELYKDGTMLRRLIPFIHKDNGTDKYGMIDLLTGTFYGDATGNNGFTISETPIHPITPTI